LVNHQFENTILFTHLLIREAPACQEAWALQGECQFYLQRFNAAEKSFSQFPDPSHEKMLQAAKKYGRIKKDVQSLTSSELLPLLESLDVSGKPLLFARARGTHSNIDDYLKLVRHMLSATNPRVKKLNFSYQKDNGSIQLDLSGNSELHDISALKKLPITVLNIEGTAITAGQMRYLEIPYLKELNMLNTSIRYTSCLDRFSGLEKVIVSKDRYPQKNLRTLRQRMTVIEK
jgi:hypothetical protein